MNNLNLKQLQKEQRTKPKVSRRLEIRNLRAEINEIEMNRTITKINKTKGWFFEKMNKIDKALATFIKKKVRGLNKTRNEKEVTTDIIEIQTIIRDYYKQLNRNKMDNLEQMDKFLESCNLPKLIQEEIKNMNISITSTEIETVIKTFQKTKVQDQMASQENYMMHLKKS